MRRPLQLIPMFFIVLMGCYDRNKPIDKKRLNGFDFRLFQGTTAWNLTKAVEDGNCDDIINEVSKNKTLLTVREPKFGQTILQLAVKREKYNSAVTLLDLGADPNLQDTYDGTSAFMEACGIGDYSDGDPRYLELLLKHGGNPNAEQKGERPQGYNVRETPLLLACRHASLQYIKILVKAGADINYVNDYKESVLYAALISGKPDIVIFLLNNGADFRTPMFINSIGEKEYITDALRSWRFDLGSEEYSKKMKIVAFLKQHGMDYRKTEIPSFYYRQYDQDYLSKY